MLALHTQGHMQKYQAVGPQNGRLLELHVAQQWLGTILVRTSMGQFVAEICPLAFCLLSLRGAIFDRVNTK
mgnify:CR=1 FL=1